MMMMAVLTLQWGCSSDDGNGQGGATGHATFTSSSAPSWTVDWNCHDASPEWVEPDPTQFECSMHLLLALNDELAAVSTAADRMSIFMSGECRCVSYRNVTAQGGVFFLLHVKGRSEEVGGPLQLRYYGAGAHLLLVTDIMPNFSPNNLMDETTELTLYPLGNTTKYPFFTEIKVAQPANMPFAVSHLDRMAVFVGDECRGVLSYDAEDKDGWTGFVHSSQAAEQAQVRYYSAEKGGIYAFSPTVTLNNRQQMVEISF